MKKITRRQVDAWLSPVRRSLREMRTGETDSIRGYAVTRMRPDDNYVRTDYCLAGFRGLLSRLMPEIDASPLLKVEPGLAHGVPLTVGQIDAALSLLKSMEKPLMRKSAEEVKSAVLTEQINIELDAMSGGA